MKIITPESFEKDWYGFLVNQISHIAFGVTLVFFACAIYWVGLGEFPVRWELWIGLAVLYIGIIELWVQGWHGLDTVNDSIFVLVYGAGATLYTFEEVGEGLFVGDITKPVPFFFAAGIHLIAGVLVRVYRAEKSNGLESET